LRPTKSKPGLSLVRDSPGLQKPLTQDAHRRDPHQHLDDERATP
jgi:hypothetical protein